MTLSPIHQFMGEALGFICWLWIFVRFREDGDVLLGYRHPWDPKFDPWAPSIEHGEDEHEMEHQWDNFYAKSTKPGEDDDDEDEDEEEEDDNDEDEE